jgi:hypothetical protein
MRYVEARHRKATAPIARDILFRAGMVARVGMLMAAAAALHACPVPGMQSTSKR